MTSETEHPHPDFPTGPDLSDAAGWPADLGEKHRLYLHDRGVSAAVAAARPYSTAVKQNQLSEWGKNNPVRLQVNSHLGHAAMVIPLYDFANPTPLLRQVRLDEPRVTTEGKRPKFEIPPSPNGGTRRNGIEPGDLPADVHPLLHDRTAESECPLLLTEGIPKADAVLTAALAADIEIIPVGLTGVTMGYEALDRTDGGLGKTYRLTKSIERLVAGRSKVYLCWDADWTENPMVKSSLVRTGELISRAGVEEVVFLAVPPVNGDRKAGVDDWLAAGGDLADLLANHQMPAPDSEAEERGEFVEAKFEVDEDRRYIWSFEMRRIGSSAKPVPTPTVQFGAIAHVVGTLSECSIVDHELRPDAETLTVRVKWFDSKDQPRSSDIEVPIAEFRDVRSWTDRTAETAQLTIAPSRTDQTILANTISHYSRRFPQETTTTASTSGWFFDRGPRMGDTDGWKYIHGSGWIGSQQGTVVGSALGEGSVGPIPLQAPQSGSDAQVALGSEARFNHPLTGDDQTEMAAAWKQWFDDWVLGGIVDRLVAEDPERFAPKTAEDTGHLEDLKVRLAFGALIVARSLLPGRPAMGTPLLFGPPSAGKTKLALTWASCFGPHYGEKPFVSFSSTSAGVEVKLAEARNMLALVDDFRPASIRDMEVMSRVIDQIARGSYDGAVRSRSTRDLKVLAAPQISGSVVLTGEELPSQTAASNSTVQRLLVMQIKHATAPTYEMLTHISSERTEPQRQAVGFMIGELARRLDTMSDLSTQSTPKLVSDAAAALMASLAEEQQMLYEDVIGRTFRVRGQEPTERTKTVIKDLMAGGSLLMGIAHATGVFTRPREVEQAVDALATAAGWAMSETARHVAESTPAKNILHLLSDALGAHRGYLTTDLGGHPADDSALTWGWKRGRDDMWETTGAKIGYAMVLDGKPVVALNPSETAKVLRQQAGDKDFNFARLTTLLRDAVAFDGKPAVVPSANGEGLRRMSIGGSRPRVVVVRPEVLGVDVSSVVAPRPDALGDDGKGL